MAEINNIYNISITANESKEELSPSNSITTLFDSIHKIFPTGEIMTLDIAGVARANGLYLPGLPFEISYEITDETDTIKCKYQLQNHLSAGNQEYGSMNDKIRMNLIHEWFCKQEAVSAVYEGKISDVIESELLGEGDFFDTIIDSSDNDSKWYRPHITEAEFIKKILLKRATNTNAKGTPYFCFINSNNEFNFRTYAEMYAETEVETLIFDKSSIENITPQHIMYLAPQAPPMQLYTHLKKRKIYTLSNTDGTIEELEDTLNSYPEGEKGDAPLLVKGFDDKLQSVYLCNTWQGEEKFEQDNIQGEINNHFRNGLFLERLIIRTFLNLKLVAGKTVELEIYYPEEGNFELDNYTSGKWLIEESAHVYSHIEGMTEIVVSRNKAEITNDLSNNLIV